MVAQREYFAPEEKPADVPIWREGLIGADWLALRYSPTYYGIGVPRGDGSAVILVPGFLATDFYLQEMYYWVWRMGYRGYMSRIGRNAECMEVLNQRLITTVDRAYQRTNGRKVHLIGHSLGGVLSRSVANRLPDKVASVITMGSPFRGISSHPVVMRFANTVRQRIQLVRQGETQPGCFTGYCNCPAATALRKSLPSDVVQTAIYTKTDGIVDWKVCINDDPDTNFEVKSTHGGLAFNPAVYSIIGKRLAAARKRK